MTDVDVFPSDASWLSKPTTGVHQFGGDSAALPWRAERSPRIGQVAMLLVDFARRYGACRLPAAFPKDIYPAPD
jgi:hypothetical protein